MFVEKLKLDQVKEFLRKELNEDLCYPEYGFQVELQKFGAEEWCWWVDYLSLTDNGRRSFRLLNDGITPLFDRSFEKAWIRHLYSILDKEHKIGEVYKNWYLSEKTKLFE